MISINFFCRWKLRLEIISLRPHNTIIVDTHIFHVFLWDPLMIFSFLEKSPENKNVHSNSFQTYDINIIYSPYDSYDQYIVMTRNFKTLRYKIRYSLKVLLPTISPWNKNKSQLLHQRLLDLSKESKDSKKIRSPNRWSTVPFVARALKILQGSWKI